MLFPGLGWFGPCFAKDCAGSALGERLPLAVGSCGALPTFKEDVSACFACWPTVAGIAKFSCILLRIHSGMKHHGWQHKMQKKDSLSPLGCRHGFVSIFVTQHAKARTCAACLEVYLGPEKHFAGEAQSAQ